MSASPTPDKDFTVKHFTDIFHRAPGVIARAPGRVEVLGNHTDYNEGVVLSAAIDRRSGWLRQNPMRPSACSRPAVFPKRSP